MSPRPSRAAPREPRPVAGRQHVEHPGGDQGAHPGALRGRPGALYSLPLCSVKEVLSLAGPGVHHGLPHHVLAPRHGRLQGVQGQRRQECEYLIYHLSSYLAYKALNCYTSLCCYYCYIDNLFCCRYCSETPTPSTWRPTL